MKLKFFFRNILLLFPGIYRIYQNKAISVVRKKLNPYYEREFKKLSRLVGKRWTPNLIIDIGGNLGQSSMAFDRLFTSDQLVIFEPNPPMAQQCRNLKFEKIKNVEVHQFGLAKYQERINLYTPEYNGVTFWGLASLNLMQASSLIGTDNIWKFDPSKLKIREIVVELRTLDSFNLNPDFIKIDVEGLETEIIQNITIQNLVKLSNIMFETVLGRGGPSNKLKNAIIELEKNGFSVFRPLPLISSKSTGMGLSFQLFHG